MSQQQLAARLGELGRPMQASAVAKVETGDRRVDVDDLVAFAIALNVAPARLLVPDVTEDAEVQPVASLTVPAWSLWQWASGQHALAQEDDDQRDADVRERELAFADERPTWRRLKDQHPLAAAVRDLSWATDRALGEAASDATGTVKITAVDRWLRRVDRAVTDVRRAAERLREEVADRG